MGNCCCAKEDVKSGNAEPIVSGCFCCKGKYDLRKKVDPGEIAAGSAFIRLRGESSYVKAFIRLSPLRCEVHIDMKEKHEVQQIVLPGAIVRHSTLREDPVKCCPCGWSGPQYYHFSIDHPICGSRDLYAISAERRTDWIEAFHMAIKSKPHGLSSLYGNVEKLSGSRNDKWTPRWAILIDKSIFYFEYPSSCIPRGKITLSRAHLVAVRPVAQVGKPYCFEIRSNNTMLKKESVDVGKGKGIGSDAELLKSKEPIRIVFSVGKESERNRWLAAIGERLKAEVAPAPVPPKLPELVTSVFASTRSPSPDPERASPSPSPSPQAVRKSSPTAVTAATAANQGLIRSASATASAATTRDISSSSRSRSPSPNKSSTTIAIGGGEGSSTSRVAINGPSPALELQIVEASSQLTPGYNRTLEVVPGLNVDNGGGGGGGGDAPSPEGMFSAFRRRRREKSRQKKKDKEKVEAEGGAGNGMQRASSEGGRGQAIRAQASQARGWSSMLDSFKEITSIHGSVSMGKLDDYADTTAIGEDDFLSGGEEGNEWTAGGEIEAKEEIEVEI